MQFALGGDGFIRGQGRSSGVFHGGLSGVALGEGVHGLDERVAATARRGLADHLGEAREDLHGCLRVSLRHLGIDPCNEQAHRRLMRCYARLGQVQLAERQFRTCVDTLRRQLGVTPQAETIELHRRIGQGTPG